MTSVAHNGFGCPYCRTAMAEEPEEDEESEWEDEEEEEEMFDEDAMRGFRFFWNNINGEPHDEDDEVEEWADRAAANQNQAEPNVPTTDFVAQKLREQGVTFEQLVKVICNNEHEEYQDDETAERLSDELFGKFRIIISNYTPELAIPTLHPEPLPREPLTREPIAPTLPRVPLAPTLPREPLAQKDDFQAQPKTPLRSESHSGFMITM